MRTPRPSAATVCRTSAWLVALGATLSSAAATFEVAVTDERGEPVGRVAVYATSTAPGAGATDPNVPSEAVMDQHDNQFVPHLLVVQVGTEVLFPNNDLVSHHVYSFSPAKTFELGLYKGNTHPPLVFDEPGIVVVGCNIHDGMLGYVLVVATPHFALTDARGIATFELPPGDYAVDAWTPRARPNALPAAQRLTVTTGGKSALAFRFAGRLAPEHDHSATSLSWDRY